MTATETAPKVIDHGPAKGKDAFNWPPEVEENGGGGERVLSEGQPAEPESEESEAEDTAGIEEELPESQRDFAEQMGKAVADAIDEDGPGDPDDADMHPNLEPEPEEGQSDVAKIAGELTAIDLAAMEGRDIPEPPASQPTIALENSDGTTTTIVSKKRGRGRPRKNATNLPACSENGIMGATETESNVQTTSATQNGTHAPQPTAIDAGADEFARLQAAAELAAEDAERANIAYFEAVRARADAIRTELAELDAIILADGGKAPTATKPKRGRPTKAAAAPKAAKPAKAKPGRKPKDKGDHTAAILAALKKCGDAGAPASALASTLGLDKTVVASHLAVLREDKKVKMTGRNRGARWLAK